MSMSGASAASPAVVERPSVGKVGMWMFLATDAMGFAALLLAYGFLRARADDWPDTQERLAVLQAAGMTAALVLSSFTVTLAVRAARARCAGARVAWLWATIVLGLGFLAGQALEYRHLVTAPRAMRLDTDVFSGTFFAITGYHGLHVLVGVVLLTTLLLAPRVHPRTLEVAAIFWHFVDLAWIPIFSFVYLLPIT
jgi:cytochrome c oxidase subunit 3